MLTGFLLIDKAKGPTSHDVVRAVRAITGERRCGHTGTLDPFATGLLPMCLGRATRLARFVSGTLKAYRAVVRFGFATDTYDRTGRRLGEVVQVCLDPHALQEALRAFVGRQKQVPPPFAAKKVRGRRLYELARAGVRVRPKAVEVVVRRIDLLDVEQERVTLDVEVESGTYIRSLAHDLGRRLGVGAHLEELRRTRVGPLGVEQALRLEELEELVAAGRLETALVGLSEALAELPALRLSEEGLWRVSHGNTIGTSHGVGTVGELRAGGSLRLLDPEGMLVAVGEALGDGAIRPIVVLQPALQPKDPVL